MNIPPATPDLVDSVTLSLNSTRECSKSKGFLSGYIMEKLPQTEKLLSILFFSLTQKFKVPNINADVVDTGNSHALEAVNEFFKRSFEINCLLAIKKLTAQVIGQSPLLISVNDFEGV